MRAQAHKLFVCHLPRHRAPGKLHHTAIGAAGHNPPLGRTHRIE
jgi:hypothetical protein